MEASEPEPTPDIDGDLSDADEFVHRLARAEDQWRRAAADLDNLQKRYQRELARGRIAERERTLLPWLQIVDDLERALAQQVPDAGAVTRGIEAIRSRATAILEGAGYPRFGHVGDPFDPALHEVTSTVPLTEGVVANEVVAVIRPGYGAADALLRPASVVVAKEPD